MTLSINFLCISEGSELITLGLLVPILAQEWNLTLLQQSLLLGATSLGIPVGTLLQGISDKYRRSTFILLDSVVLTVFGLFFIVCWDAASFGVTRFLYLVGVGVCIPLATTYTTEISPASMRNTLLSRSWIYWSAGFFIGCLLGWAFLDKGLWRVDLLIICLPSILALIEHLMFGRESLHFLWV